MLGFLLLTAASALQAPAPTRRGVARLMSWQPNENWNGQGEARLTDFERSAREVKRLRGVGRARTPPAGRARPRALLDSMRNLVFVYNVGRIVTPARSLPKSAFCPAWTMHASCL
mmetsp:Transcript_31489/g.106025  ORF Transcript_31489/g.106025 Transcript_31489/m.106025 type:complete len:115 (+) Transcript_31489:23-367(+)